MMDEQLDLDTFVNILTEKGYTQTFQTQIAYPDKLRESMSRYLESCKNGTDTLPRDTMLLRCYLQYSGEDKPNIECHMYVKYHNDTFSLKAMDLTQNSRYGNAMNKKELQNLSVYTVPKATDAIAMVTDEPQLKANAKPKGFKL